MPKDHWHYAYYKRIADMQVKMRLFLLFY
uniref:Uncharacterized protein n=1 Tax=Rhizophora mucronata TaxID=61149 RepID=A0A2P2PXF6_RHIMU